MNAIIKAHQIMQFRRFFHLSSKTSIEVLLTLHILFLFFKNLSGDVKSDFKIETNFRGK